MRRSQYIACRFSSLIRWFAGSFEIVVHRGRYTLLYDTARRYRSKIKETYEKLFSHGFTGVHTRHTAVLCCYLPDWFRYSIDTGWDRQGVHRLTLPGPVCRASRQYTGPTSVTRYTARLIWKKQNESTGRMGTRYAVDGSIRSISHATFSGSCSHGVNCRTDTEIMTR